MRIRAAVSAATWVERVTERDISRLVGAAALSRAHSYVTSGAVRTLVEGDGGRVLLATVAGSRSSQYQTVIRLLDASHPPRWSGECSCPMSYDCKHTAAVLLTAKAALMPGRAPRVQPWEQVLAPLVQAAPGGAPAETGLPALALEVSLVTSPSPTRGALLRKVRVRPLREGKGKPWVKQGANWSDLTNTWGGPKLRADHRAVVADLLTLYRAAVPGSYYGYGNPDIHLDDLGSAVWPLLRRCELTGVPMIAGSSDLRSVRLTSTTAEVSVDLTRRPDQGGLSVRPVLSLGDGIGPDSDSGLGQGQDADGEGEQGTVLLLGAPAHGVGVLTADGTLSLAPLAAPPPPALRALLQDRAAIEVPEADTARFLGLYYPVLARRLPVGSSDHSVALPEDIAPVLTLEAAYRPGHRLELTWGFAYRMPTLGTTDTHNDIGTDISTDTGTDISTNTGGTEVRVGLDAGPADPPRDLEGERALLSGLTELHAIPRMLHRSVTGAVQPHQQSTLAGMDTVTFTTQVLPVLQARDDVLVHVLGEPAAYVEADEAPVVHLETTDAPDQQGDWVRPPGHRERGRAAGAVRTVVRGPRPG